MNARDGLTKISVLRTHALQDFLKLILPEDWRQHLYEKAKYAVENNSYKESYIAAYEKMREVGIELYCVEDMDVKIMNVIIQYCKQIVKTHRYTQNAVRKLSEDRNESSHSGENEDEEELYLRGLLELCDLRSFIRVVDRNETAIDNSLRENYLQKYIADIRQLMDQLDEERIELIQWRKGLDRDIQRVITSKDPSQTWGEIFENYFNRYFTIEKNYEKYDQFMIAASDAGIAAAHIQAARYFVRKEDYTEAERRILMLSGACDKLEPSDARKITSMINSLHRCTGSVSNEMKRLAERIIAEGNPVEVNDSGQYLWRMKDGSVSL